MPSLPIATDFTGAGVTEAGFKTAITNQREFLAGLLGTTGNQVDALVALGALGADTVSKTANYTVIDTDRGKAILCSGTFTLSLTAAATLGDGFTFLVKNTGSGTITIVPNSTELIDGSSTKTLAANEWALVVCSGTTFNTFGSSKFVQEPSVSLLGTISTTSGSSVSLSSLNLTSYNFLKFVINNLSGSTGGDFVFLSSTNVTSGGGFKIAYDVSDSCFGILDLNLSTGIISGSVLDDYLLSTSDRSLNVGGLTNITKSSTIVYARISSGNFDGGSISIYGIK